MGKRKDRLYVITESEALPGRYWLKCPDQYEVLLEDLGDRYIRKMRHLTRLANLQITSDTPKKRGKKQ